MRLPPTHDRAHPAIDKAPGRHRAPEPPRASLRQLLKSTLDRSAPARHLARAPARRPARFVLAIGVVGLMGGGILAGELSGAADPAQRREASAFSMTDRDRSDVASRAGQRAAAPQAAPKAAPPKTVKAPAKRAAAPKRPVMPRPVGGLSQVQMNNAAAIVKAG